jgi:ribosomal protein S18 acetylase RimI-like enzyme
VDLPSANEKVPPLPESVTIECWDRNHSISTDDMVVLCQFRDERIIKDQFELRFQRDAEIWLVRQKTKIAGFVWCIKGKTMQPYFFPLARKDVHLFDNEIFFPYRGNGFNPLLIDHVIEDLRLRRYHRVFIETRKWNKAELRSLSKTKLQIFGVAKKLKIFGKGITLWAE